MSRRSLPYGLLAAVGLLGFLAGSILNLDAVSLGALFHDNAAESRLVTERTAPLGPEEQTTVDLFERSARSVVFIATSQLKSLVLIPDGSRAVPLVPELRARLRRDWTRNPGTITVPLNPTDPAGARQFTFDPTVVERNFEWGSGSGFVWDKLGHIVTNYHVVNEAWDLMVRLPNGPGLTDFPATLVGFDEDKDLAVIRVKAPRELLEPLAVGRSAPLKVGQKAFSLGNPFGLSSSLTEGIISALRRTIRSGTGAGRIIQDVIQTDAAINPGNSGGPLLDSAGRLIGVTTATLTDAGNSSGIGFAIPVDTVNRIVPDLINFGRVKRAGIGIRVQTELVSQLDGVMIAYVLPGSSAEKAGLRGGMNPETLVFDRKGDIIVAIDDEPVSHFDDLWQKLDNRFPGDVVKVTYRREQKIFSARIELSLLPEERRGSGEEAP